MIRKAVLSDVDFVFEMYMHPIINPHLLYEQMGRAEFIPIFSSLLSDDIMYIFENDGRETGMVKLIPHTHRSAHIVYVGSVAVHPSFSGKGYGMQMLKEIIAFADDKNFKRIELSVGVQNEKALALYKKAGFEEEGVLRKYTYLKSENRYIDEMMMSYIIE
jgi:L-phenylalanine/L-methionine N-acetyltransferase